MINVANKASLVPGYFKASTQVIAAGLKPCTATAIPQDRIVTTPKQESLTSYTLGKIIPGANMRVSSGPGGEFVLALSIVSVAFVEKYLWLHNS